MSNYPIVCMQHDHYSCKCLLLRLPDNGMKLYLKKSEMKITDICVNELRFANTFCIIEIKISKG